MAMSEICQINRGRVISKSYLRDNGGEYPVYSSQTENNGVFGFIGSFDYDCESITWTTDGANAGSIFYHHDEKFSITNVCGLLQVINPNEISAKYVYYALGQDAKKHVSSGMGNPKLMSNAMSRIKIPVPSLTEQEHIVSILDKFDGLVNDISSGLPAEIKARRQQYEHYRDKLLSFAELEATA
jgi:type I restriction enzyme S subunit